MYLALFLVALLFLYGVRATKQPFYKYAVFITLMVLFPVTQLGIKIYFQYFYQEDYFIFMLPIIPVIAFTIILVYEKLWDKWKKYSMMPIVCILIALCGCILGDGGLVTENPIHSKEELEYIYDLILEEKQDEEILLLGPEEIITEARRYSAKLTTVYGRDLWERELGTYFYDCYEPYMYELYQYLEGTLEGNEELFLEAIYLSNAEYVVFDKETLTFDENMHYPKNLSFGDEMVLNHLDETGHYVIYKRN